VTAEPISFTLERDSPSSDGTAMNIEVNPETERLVREEITSGHFRSVDELIITSVHAWHQKNLVSSVSDGAKADLAAEARQKAGDAIHELRKGVTLDRPKGMSLREYAHIGQDANPEPTGTDFVAAMQAGPDQEFDEGAPQSISAMFREIWSDMPDDVRAKLPADGADQIDHYVYGVPKRER
jgi:Arc/MetJ-type ribon-helix-helix transcriptional regulator